MKLKRYFKELAEISIPIILGNLGFIFIGVGDVIVAGRHSTQTLAAVSIATAVLNCIAMVGVGIISSVAPIVSNKRGEGKSAEKYYYPTIKFAVTISFIVALLMLGFIPLVDHLGYSEELAKQIKIYSFITAFSPLGAYLHSASKDFLQAFEIVVFPNILTIFSVFLNICLNIIFVFGYLGLPEMGVAGLALASLVVRYFMGISLFIYTHHKLKIPHNTKLKGYYSAMLKIGCPIALAILIEFIAFNIVPVVLGRISEIYAAAQNILCTLTTIPFMVALAVSNAVSVKVGYSNGARNFLDLRRFAVAGLIISESFMLLSIITLLLFPAFVLGLFTTDNELVKTALPIVYILAAFQLFDGLQVTLAGVFKGLKDTKIVLIANLIGYWGICIPLGTFLAFHYKLYLAGYWYATGLAAIILNIILMTKLIKRYKEWQAIKQ